MDEKKLLSMGEQETCQYTIQGLSPNATYQFKLAIVNKLGIEGEYAETKASTASKTHANIAT